MDNQPISPQEMEDKSTEPSPRISKDAQQEDMRATEDFSFKIALLSALISAIIATTISTTSAGFGEFIHPNQESLLVCQVSLRGGSPIEGSQLLQWEFDIRPAKEFRFEDNEVWCSLDLDLKELKKIQVDPHQALDFSTVAKIRFYISANRELAQLDEFNLFTGTGFPLYQYRYTDIPVSTTWQLVEIDLSKMRLAPWLKSGAIGAPEKPDLTHVVAFGFAVKSRDRRRQGGFAIDDISLINMDGTEVRIEGFEVPQLEDLESRVVLGRNAGWVCQAGALR